MKQNNLYIFKFPIPTRIALLALVALALSVFLYFFLRSDRLLKSNFFDNQIEFKFSHSASKTFDRFLKKTKQNNIFKKGTINILFKKSLWKGRIFKNGTSRQALFTVDASKIICNWKNFRATGLRFIIYNSRKSNLLYNIYVKYKKSCEKIFSRDFNQQEFYKGYIKLDKYFNRKISIILETKGRGVGAWINPVFSWEEQKPKIYVIIMLDTLRYDHTSLFGYKRDTTPALAKLAQDGVMFSNAYSTTSWTYPAHVSLFSGLNLIEHKIFDQKKKILDEYPLLAEIFQKNGFLTAAFTGGGYVSDIYGFHRGFMVYSNKVGNEFDPTSSKKVFMAFKNHIKKNWGRDMFFFLHTYQIHTPYNNLPQKTIGKFNKNVNRKLMSFKNFIKNKLKISETKNYKVQIQNNANLGKYKKYFMSISEENRKQLVDLYDASIFYADQVLVNNVVNYLKKIGAYDEAMIVVTSDHGEEFYDHGSWEHGHTLYNELIKIPLVIKYPRGKKKGIENSLTSITDIPGIILKESGFKYKKSSFAVKICDKKRILPILLPHSPIIKQISPKLSLVNKDYHYIFNLINKQALKFFDPQPLKTPVYELYSTSDINEKNNLYKMKLEILLRFKNLQKKYLQMINKINIYNKPSRINKNLKNQLKSLGYLGD